MADQAVPDVQPAQPTPEQLAVFYARRHPKYDDLLPHWRFLIACYKGGPAWFADNIFPYHKEGPKEFKARLKRGYRFNHTREVVGLVQKYLFKAPITRNVEDAPKTVTEFWKRSTLGGQSIEQLMRNVSISNAICGRVAVVVDNNFVLTKDDEGRKLSEAEAKTRGIRAYAYVVEAPDILDYAFDEDDDGELLWIKLREVVRDDRDPLHSDGDYEIRVRLITRQGWILFREAELPKATLNPAPGKPQHDKTLEIIGQGEHGLGFVPVRLADHVIGNEPYEAQALIDEIAYLDRAVTNYLSNLDAIIQDQTFSQLAIPASSIMQGEDKMKKVLEMGTKRTFTYDGQGGAVPHYLSPDPKQAGVIISVINKIIAEIYNTIGLAGERTKEDNAMGIDNSSGVAKAYDFERVNALLLSKAQSCESLENWIANTVLAWHGEDEPDEKLVSYPETFDVMRLADELVTAEALTKLQAPKEVRRAQMRALVKKLFPQASVELRKRLKADIDKWLNDVVDTLQPPAGPGQKPVAAPSRQGSTTRDTPTKAGSK